MIATRTLLRFPSKFSLLFWGLSICGSAPAATPTPADRVFQQVAPMVYKIKTSIDSESPKASYGSGFVVGKDGLILTNFHVVSLALQEPKKYKIYLVDEKSDSLEATAIAVSATHDLALLKVNRTFSKILTLSQKPPVQGQKIFSIGIPKDLNLSIVEGTYNGVVDYGPYEQIHMSSPINSGMSGGPTVDQSGAVVGVNVAILVSSQSISFSVPIRFGWDLLREGKNFKNSEQFLGKGLDHQITQELKATQEELFSKLKSPGQTALGGWKVAKTSAKLKCWSTNRDDEKGRFEGTSLACYLDHATFVQDDIYSGSYEISFTTFKNREFNGWQLFNFLNDVYNADTGNRSVYLFHTDEKDFFTEFECGERVAVSTKGIAFKINFCLRAYLRYPDLYIADYKFASLGGTKVPAGSMLIGRGSVQGVTLENLQKLIRWQVEGVEHP